MKAADFGKQTSSVAAFVSTNSVCQGQQVPILWPLIFDTGHEISFAHTSFKWENLASHNAGVTVVIVGISDHPAKTRALFTIGENGSTTLREAENINAYLAAAPNVEVEGIGRSASGLHAMQFGNHPYYGAALIFSKFEALKMQSIDPRVERFIRPLYGSQEFISASRGNKTEIVLALLRRPNGVALAEVMEATGWQAHSVRGFLSGTVKTRLGLTLSSETQGKTRFYRIEG